MPTSVRESIMANLATTLLGITVAGGYLTTVAHTFDRLPAGEVGPGDFVTILALEPETYDELADPKLSRTLPLLLIYSRRVRGDTAHVEGLRALADMEKAILADRTRGGYAFDTQLGSNVIIDPEASEPLQEVQLRIRVQYRTHRTNPFSAS